MEYVKGSIVVPKRKRKLKLSIGSNKNKGYWSFEDLYIIF